MHQYMPGNDAVPGIGLLKDETIDIDKEILKTAGTDWRDNGILKKFN